MFEPRTVKLKDDKEVLIRAMKREDLEGSLVFFRALSEEDRLSLRRDLTTRERIEERSRDCLTGQPTPTSAITGLGGTNHNIVPSAGIAHRFN